MQKSFKLKIPASSANIGPGFDVLGIGLNLYLELQVNIDSSKNTCNNLYNLKLTYEGEGFDKVSLNPSKNLVIQAALYILRCNNIDSFPNGTFIHVINPIPLSRGLGSSAAAIVGGIMLGNEIGELKLSKFRLLDYCLLIERHPDNIAAAMLGGFVGSYLNELSRNDTVAKNVLLDYILPKDHISEDKYIKASPPKDIGQYVKYNWCKRIKCITIIPNFEVATNDSRSMLPDSYNREDIIFNLQRIAILVTALTLNPPNPKLIYEAMKDKIHQPYRTKLIPGLTEVLSNITPDTNKGLCGVCLSGAGPTILCLATENFSMIANEVISIFNRYNIQCEWKLLDLAYDGAKVEY